MNLIARIQTTRRVLACLALAGLAASVALRAATAQQAARVAIETGTVEGVSVATDPGEFMFLGIPYAAAPIGRLRWRPPAAAPRWPGVRKADAFGPSCPQGPGQNWVAEFSDEMVAKAPWLKGLRYDEDCLYLNVWTPERAASTDAPVMVWIHGGGNTSGSGNLPPFGPTLPRRGVVLVSINYRLGPLGFLAHPALSRESPHHASGNYALLDQVQALRWVRQNIRAFGGDPANVTVFGASAGGGDTCALVASPLARGLFRRAIVESNACGDVVMPELQRAIAFDSADYTGEQQGVRFAQRLGIGPDEDALAAMRAKPVSAIVAATDDAAYMDILVDGWVMPRQPAELFAEGRQAPVSILIGSNADESSMFADPSIRDTAKYRAWLATEFREGWRDVFDAYPAASDSAVRAAYLAATTDHWFGYGAYTMARAMRRLGQPVYLYNVTYAGKGRMAQFGAFHSIEAFFLSGTFRASWGAPDADDWSMASTIATYWTNFARTGDPNGPGLPQWVPYELATDSLLELGHATTMREVSKVEQYRLFERLLTARLVALQKRRR